MSSSCSASQSAATNTPKPTATITAIPTKTLRPSPTPRPTQTPNVAATQQIETWNTEAQEYFELGYLKTAQGTFTEYDDFNEEWAQLGWYNRWTLAHQAGDF